MLLNNLPLSNNILDCTQHTYTLADDLFPIMLLFGLFAVSIYFLLQVIYEVIHYKRSTKPPVYSNYSFYPETD